MSESIAGVAIAALDMCQKILTALVKKGVLTREEVVQMLRESTNAHDQMMDDSWAPANDHAAQILGSIAAAHEAHGKPEGSTG